MIPSWNEIAKIAGACLATVAMFTFMPDIAGVLCWIIIFSCAYHNVKNLANRNPEVKEVAKGALIKFLRNSLK